MPRRAAQKRGEDLQREQRLQQQRLKDGIREDARRFGEELAALKSTTTTQARPQPISPLSPPRPRPLPGGAPPRIPIEAQSLSTTAVATVQEVDVAKEARERNHPGIQLRRGELMQIKRDVPEPSSTATTVSQAPAQHNL